MASLEQPMPGMEAVLVEYPGFVRDSDAALDTLGGTQAVSATAGGEAPLLQLHFRRDDPLSHPLLGNLQATKGLLLRLKREPGAPQDESGAVTAEVVARVSSAVRFHGLADFQYVSTDTRAPPELASRPDDPPGLEPEPMLFPPQLFTKQDIPLDYAFRSFYAGDPEWLLARAGVATGRSVGRLAPHVISFQAVNIVQPLGDEAEIAGLFKGRRATVEQLAELFKERPIWSTFALKERLTGLENADVDVLVPRIAYVFRNGPFRHLWIQRGYDPRKFPASRMYQAVDCTSSTGVPARQTGSAGPQPAGEVLMQLCDLQDSSIFELLEAGQLLNICDSKTGWFPSEVWHDLQRRAHAIIEACTTSRDCNTAQAAATCIRGQQEPESRQPAAQSAATPMPTAAGAEATGGSGRATGGSGGATGGGGADTGRVGATPAPQPNQAAAQVAIPSPAGQEVQHEGPGILPAAYLQSVLDNWPSQAPGPPIQGTQAPLTADFEIYEEDDEEENGEDLDTAGGYHEDGVRLEGETDIGSEAEGGMSDAEDAGGEEEAHAEESESGDDDEDDSESDVDDNEIDEDSGVEDDDNV